MFEINGQIFDKERGNLLEVYSGVAYRVTRKKKIITKDDLTIDPDSGNLKIDTSKITTVEKIKVERAKIKKHGTREEVWIGSVLSTKGGLTKDKLMLNTKGKLVSKARAEAARARFLKMKTKKDSKIAAKEPIAKARHEIIEKLTPVEKKSDKVEVEKKN